MRRIARLADGWIMLPYSPGHTAIQAFYTLRTHINEVNRVPSDVGLEVWTSAGVGDDNKLRRDVQF